MTSLPIQSSRAPLAQRDWLPLEDVARAMGMNAGHARRKCADEWEPAGNAKKDASGSWTIHRRISPRLIHLEAEAATGASIAELLRTTPAAKLRVASQKAEAVRSFRAWRMRDDVRVDAHWDAFARSLFASTGMEPVGLRQMRALDERCPASHDHDGMIAALLDRRGRPKEDGAGAGGGALTTGQEAWDAFLDLYLRNGKWSIAKCWRSVQALAAQHADRATGEIPPAWSWPSVRRIHQLVQERIDPGTRCLARQGQQAWDRTHATPIDQDPNAFAAGECWESDHTPFDLFVRVRLRPAPGSTELVWRAIRPRLTAWMDRRTRRLMGWHIDEEGSSGTIRAALLHALRDEHTSVPAIAWLDNGKDFVSAALHGRTNRERHKDENSAARGVLSLLGIEAHFGLAHNPNAKARIERFFGTMHRDFDVEFASWCGARPGERDPDAVRAAHKDVMSLPTLDDLRERFAAWAEAYNHRDAHAIDDLIDEDLGRRISPEQYYQRHALRRPLVDRSSLRLLEQAFDRPRKVLRTGISVTIGGRTVRYGAGVGCMMPELEPLVGTDARVIVSYDPSGGGDTRQVTVWTQDYRLICIAPENERTGGVHPVTSGDRKVAFDAKRAQRRRAKAKVDVAALALTDAQYAAKVARERAVASTQEQIHRDGLADAPSAQAPLTLVRTPLDGQANALERAELRQAVGAETIQHDPDPVDLRLAQWIDEADAEPGPSDDLDEDIEAALSGGFGDHDDTNDDIIDELTDALDLVEAQP